MPTIDLYGYQIKTNVIDRTSGQPLEHLWLGRAYGQIVETTKFHQLVTKKILIRSELQDTQQLAFRSEGTAAQDERFWEWELYLSPYQLAGSQTKLLVCGSRKIRHREKISVEVQGDDHGATCIEVDIA